PNKRIEIDWDLCARMLDEGDLTEAEKRQMLEALWSIIVMLVDLGFGVHPVEQACGQPCEWAAPRLAPPTEPMVKSEENQTPNNKAALPAAAERRTP
ncbi:MAG: hypothetical protein AAF698_10555, partial [Pseudomonadota bacterium]